MSERPPLQFDNKVYELRWPFVSAIQSWIRKLRLKLYKKKKIKESKTEHQRFYHMKFKINVSDEINPQETGTVYEMVVPARAAFFAKMLLERSIKKKIEIKVIDWEELDSEEHDNYLESQNQFHENKPA